MRIRAPWLAVIAVLAVTTSARAQKKDVLEWLPAQTLACVEVRNPDRLAREVAALVKGSVLEDLPLRMARLRAPGNPRMDWRVRSQLTALEMFLSPEIIDEAGRVRGGFVALTGFDSDNTPEVVGVLQTGGSNFPGLMMRIFLIESNVNVVGEVEGVPVYRDRMQRFRNVGGVQRVEETDGVVAAQLPGALVLGNSVTAVSDVIRRSKSKSSEASLTSLRAFRQAAELRGRPGLFAYADVAAIGAQLDEQTRKPGHPLGRTWGLLKTIVGDETVRTMTASLTLEGGALRWQVKADLGGKGNSPLLSLLPDKPAPRELLHFAPDDALLALGVGLGEGEKRWKTLLALLDALDKLAGDRQEEGKSPSDGLRRLEAKVQLQIGKEIIAPVTGAALVVDGAGRGETPYHPLLILRATDADAARALEEKGLPKLIGLTRGETPVPTEEEVDGQRIRSVADALPGRKALRYGRRGAVLVVGMEGRRVARALTAGAKKEGLAAGEDVAAALKEVETDAVLVGVVSSAQAANDLSLLMGHGPVPAKNVAGPGGAKAPPPPAPEKPARNPVESRTVRDVRLVGEPLPPLVVTMSRRPDSLLLEMRPVGLRRAVPALLNLWVESILEGAGQGRAAPGIGAAAPAPPAKKQ